MAEQDEAPDAAPSPEDEAPASPTPPRRSMGHRGADVRDTVAEMTARAHEISLEAGSKMTGVIRDVINAAAGLAEFATESARDLVQYMVRRGQMSQDDGERLLREAEEAQARRKGATGPAAPTSSADPAAGAKKGAAKPAPAAERAVAAPSVPDDAPEPAPMDDAATPTVAKKAPTAKAPAKAPAVKGAAAKAPAAPAKAPAAKQPAKAPAVKSASRPTAAKPPTKAAAKKAPAKKR